MVKFPLKSVVWSQYQKSLSGKETFADREGWIKGWVLKPNVFVTCSHANPAPAGASKYTHGWVYVDNGVKKEWRKIVSVYKLGETDISVCKVDKPFPKWATPLNISSTVPKQVTVLYKDLRVGEKAVKLVTQDKITLAWEKGEDFLAGDSGLPWVYSSNGIWYVVGHTHLGWYGQSPSYPVYKKDILNAVNSL